MISIEGWETRILRGKRAREFERVGMGRVDALSIGDNSRSEAFVEVEVDSLICTGAVLLCSASWESCVTMTWI